MELFEIHFQKLLLFFVSYMQENLDEILTSWDIKIKEIIPKNSSVWEINAQYILKKFDNIEIIDKNIKIIQSLKLSGIPVATIINTHNNELYLNLNKNQFLLTEKLPGNTIQRINEKQIGFIMGKAIGQLHLAFRVFDNILTFRENSLLTELDGWVKNNFKKSNWKLIDESEFLNFVDRLRNNYNELPRQLIHRDVHFGNFLFLNGEFTGYIDFDLSQKNIRIFDLCYFLAGLLTDKNVNKSFSIEEWLLFVKCTVNGYETQIKLNESEKFAFSIVMEGIELLCASYFIGINNCDVANDCIKVYNKIKTLETDILANVRNDTSI